LRGPEKKELDEGGEGFDFEKKDLRDSRKDLMIFISGRILEENVL